LLIGDLAFVIAILSVTHDCTRVSLSTAQPARNECAQRKTESLRCLPADDGYYDAVISAVRRPPRKAAAT